MKILEARNIPFRFHDVRAGGLQLEKLARWADALGWETLLNRKSATWRGLPEDQRANLDRGKALSLMLAHPALIKRPILEDNDALRIGLEEK
jgi:Spx/MgsR family transcriptional regulator